MLVGQVLQERYHLVARVQGNADRDTYVALDKAINPQGNGSVQYIIKHYWPTAQNAGPMLEKRLQAAAQIQQFNHLAPQLPPLLQYWLEAEQLFLAYEYIDGQNITAAIVGLNENEVISLLAEMIEILQPLHQRQTAHGNLHPGQLLRRQSDQKLILTDLGSLALTEQQTFGDPQLLRQDLKALGQMAAMALGQPEDVPEAWRARATPSLQNLIDRLSADQPLLLMDAWLELGQLMHHILAHAPVTEFDLVEIQARADRQLRLGNAPGAIEECNKLIALNPHPVYFHNRGIIYAQELHDYQRAIQDYDQAIALSPDLSHAYKNRAYAHWQQGNLSAAIADYGQSVERLPNLAIVYWERALVLEAIGETELALADLNRFLAYHPHHGEAYLRRAALQEHQGEIVLAIQDCNLAIECHPYLSAAYYQRGNLRVLQQAYELAIADYNQALTIDPQFALAYQRRGAIYFQQGALDQARHDYLQAISLAPSATLYYQYGLMAADRRVALESFDRALALEPGLAKVYGQRARLFQQDGQLDMALADYDRVLAIEPDSLTALYGRGLIRQKLADYGGAVSDYQRAANLLLDRGQQQEYEHLLRVLETIQKVTF